MTGMNSDTITSSTPPEDIAPTLAGMPENVGGFDPSQGQQQVDYFGFGAGSTERYMFPDGITFIEFGKLNEGEKAAYEARTQGDFTLQRGGDAKIAMDPGRQRHELIKSSTRGWNLISQGQSVPFNMQTLSRWLQVADPTLVEKLAEKITDLNPWLRSDQSAEDLRAEIDRLNKALIVAEKREAGEGASSNR